jgi:hypothetical protein
VAPEVHLSAAENKSMSSSWPILLGVFALVVAAFWYDATVASAGAAASLPVPDASSVASERR